MGFGSSLKKAAKKLTGGKAGNVAKNAAIFGSPTNTLIKLGRDGKLDDIAKGAAILGSPTNMLLYGLKKSGVSFGGSGDDYGGGGAGGAPQLTPQQMQQQMQQMQWHNDMNGIFAKMASAYGVDPMMYQRQMQQIPQMSAPANALMQQQPQQQPVNNMLLQAPPAFTGMPGAAQQPIAQQPITQRQPGGMQRDPFQSRMDRFRTPIFRQWGR